MTIQELIRIAKQFSVVSPMKYKDIKRKFIAREHRALTLKGIPRRTGNGMKLGLKKRSMYR